MKKTLAALIVGAFAASAANAAVIYDNEGTKVELNGSLRILLEKSNKEGGSFNQKIHSHSGLKNNDSRFEIKVKHTLDNDFYALARVEARFDGKQGGGTDEDGFGNMRAHRAYVGLGKQELGQLTFGRQVTIADDVGIADDYTYGILPDYVPTSGKSVVRYDYYGVPGLQIGASYQFAEKRDPLNEVRDDEIKNGSQVGVLYNGADATNPNGWIAEAVYGRTNYKSSGEKSHKDAFQASLGYDFQGIIVSVDGGYFKAKNVSAENVEAKAISTGRGDAKGYFVSPGFQVPVIDNVSKVYGNYLYQQIKTTDQSPEYKEKTHGFLLGVDYKLHKQVVTYVEGKYLQTKAYKDGNQIGDKVKDKAIGVGMRVYF
ncbi:porin [Rodentibacter myodis]|uniref:Porin domain-containing protein n=1 Tax=Rodentibacter myodis TaxID=1907939 RepID=A0A1V3JVB0_9PAST|nr:porin [Rodentibacter myodis]OOF60268.1 hypothetical protein BKL49_00825 [Rodentibacter myodis]